MIYGIGVDIAEVSRFRQIIARHGDKFARKEAIRKSKCVAPLFNKGAYQFIGSVSEAKTLGR